MAKPIWAAVLALSMMGTLPLRASSAAHLVSAGDVDLRLAGAAQARASTRDVLQDRIAALRAAGALTSQQAAAAEARLPALDDEELQDLAARVAALDADPASAGAGRVLGTSALAFLGLVLLVAAICVVSSPPTCSR